MLIGSAPAGKPRGLIELVLYHQRPKCRCLKQLRITVKTSLCSLSGKKLWRLRGVTANRARGQHSGGLESGDRIFISATKAEELYLLGAIEVKRGGKNWCEGRSLFAPFQIIALRGLRWKLRFEQTKAVRLARETTLAMQVRPRQRLKHDSAKLLIEQLSLGMDRVTEMNEKILAHEGKRKEVILSVIERDPKVRARAIMTRGLSCEICLINLGDKYGDFAQLCVEVHHLYPL